MGTPDFAVPALAALIGAGHDIATVYSQPPRPAGRGHKLQPSPVQNPCPIWIASNPTGLTWRGGASASEAVIERSFMRVARYADGWMTNKVTPEQFRQQWGRIGALARAEGRDPA